MALLDGKGFTDDKGETAFAYAHPLFWAPYSIIGHAGRCPLLAHRVVSLRCNALSAFGAKRALISRPARAHL